MSLRSRRDLIGVTYERYQEASASKKKEILNEFVSATGYGRKYALSLLLHTPRLRPLLLKCTRKREYGASVKQAVVIVWKVGNCICTKRLMPFLPELLKVMERQGEITLEPHVQAQLLWNGKAEFHRWRAKDPLGYNLAGGGMVKKT